MGNLSDVALKEAHRILATECSPIGLMASPEGYPHVWARDSVITSLGASLSPGHENCLRVSLRTLGSQQSELGAIPNNVSVATGRLDHTNAGSVDSNLWFILGHAFQYRVTGQVDFLREAWPTLDKALLWLRYQDSNGCGLLEVHEAADWADLLANRFNVLYDNVLWYAALRAMAEMSRALGLDGSRYDCMADDVRHKIRIVLWVGEENELPRGKPRGIKNFTSVDTRQAAGYSTRNRKIKPNGDPIVPAIPNGSTRSARSIRCWSSGRSSCPTWPSATSATTAMCSATCWRSCSMSPIPRRKNAFSTTCIKSASPSRIRCAC